jgi:hypothetical protein
MAKGYDTPTSLNEEQMKLINEGTLILLSTLDQENGAPSISAISWVKVNSASKVRFAVTNQSRIAGNIRRNPRVSLTFMGLGTVFTISGNASILEEKMNGVTMPLAKIEVDVKAVYESMFWGAKITETPKYEKTYDYEKAHALDKQVYAALLA